MAKKLILIHAMIELIGGVVISLRPDLILMTSDQIVETLIVGKLYGILMITFGILSYLLWKEFRYDELYKKVFLLFMIFHLLIGFHMMSAYNQGIVANLGAFGLHMALAASFLLVYMREMQLFSQAD